MTVGLPRGRRGVVAAAEIVSPLPPQAKGPRLKTGASSFSRPSGCSRVSGRTRAQAQALGDGPKRALRSRPAVASASASSSGQGRSNQPAGCSTMPPRTRLARPAAKVVSGRRGGKPRAGGPPRGPGARPAEAGVANLAPGEGRLVQLQALRARQVPVAARAQGLDYAAGAVAVQPVDAEEGAFSVRLRLVVGGGQEARGRVDGEWHLLERDAIFEPAVLRA